MMFPLSHNKGASRSEVAVCHQQAEAPQQCRHAHTHPTGNTSRAKCYSISVPSWIETRVQLWKPLLCSPWRLVLPKPPSPMRQKSWKEGRCKHLDSSGLPSRLGLNYPGIRGQREAMQRTWSSYIGMSSFCRNYNLSLRSCLHCQKRIT